MGQLMQHLNHIWLREALNTLFNFAVAKSTSNGSHQLNLLAGELLLASGSRGGRFCLW